MQDFYLATIIMWREKKSSNLIAYYLYRYDVLDRNILQLLFSWCNTTLLQEASLSVFKGRKDDSTRGAASFNYLVHKTNNSSAEHFQGISSKGKTTRPIKTAQSPLFNLMDYFIFVRRIYCISIKRACWHSIKRQEYLCCSYISHGN